MVADPDPAAWAGTTGNPDPLSGGRGPAIPVRAALPASAVDRASSAVGRVMALVQAVPPVSVRGRTWVAAGRARAAGADRAMALVRVRAAAPAVGRDQVAVVRATVMVQVSRVMALTSAPAVGPVSVPDPWARVTVPVGLATAPDPWAPVMVRVSLDLAYPDTGGRAAPILFSGSPLH